ncbi:MAG: 4-hydroxy-tetrahydrodipicolinate synthase [Candidatus Diapherotrites archaeon CG11_big_fil_rev_8_21_14_0_20_37_9]|nr:MAG: 4-hydroxy-tetrahydrodipicolinate synthase [Candidatus Diapherotrites archaeon CG11_big_fil_rev_8_21_14_0_20_37_9]
MEIAGTYTALITPFKGGEVDYDGLKKNIQFQLDNGISGILPLGTTGETPTLTSEEKDKVIQVAVEVAKGKVPIMVGTGNYSTKNTIENTLRAKELGADIALIVTPYYNKPTQEGIYLHFKAVNDAVDIPIMVYNIQGRTGKNIETSTLNKIASLKNVIGVKEASGNVGQMTDVLELVCGGHPDFNVMSGDDGLTLPLMALGGKGVVSVVSNLVPAQVVAMVDAAQKGDFEKARKLHFKLLPIFKGAFIETNPMPIKEAMNLCGMPAGGCRLPLCEMETQNREKLKQVLKEMKLI